MRFSVSGFGAGWLDVSEHTLINVFSYKSLMMLFLVTIGCCLSVCWAWGVLTGGSLMGLICYVSDFSWCWLSQYLFYRCYSGTYPLDACAFSIFHILGKLSTNRLVFGQAPFSQEPILTPFTDRPTEYQVAAGVDPNLCDCSYIMDIDSIVVNKTCVFVGSNYFLT